MRNAFTLIELMIVISIIAIIAAIAIPNLTNKRKSAPGPEPKLDHISIQIDGNRYTARKFILEGHSYFMIGGVQPGIATVHDPECPKCKAALVKNATVEVEKQ
jgi:prepilin-type N-terminal cleavage/methylation domain-containing protein